MSKRHLYALAFFLTALGLSAFMYKAKVLGLPLQPEAQTPVWTVEARLSFMPGPGSIKVNFEIPNAPPGFSILEENFVSRGYGLTTQERDGSRSAQWAIRHASGVQTLYYRALVYRDPTRTFTEPAPPYPPIPELGEPYDTAMQAVITEVRRHSADIATFTAQLLKRLNAPNPDEDIALFLTKVTTPAGRAATATTLLAGARIPTQVVQGILLEDQQRRAQITPWLAVHTGEEWLFFDPAGGRQGLPTNFLIWGRGAESLARIKKAKTFDLEIAVKQSLAEAMSVAERRAELAHSRLIEFSLLSLPIGTQAVYTVLMLIPLGAFIVLLLRNVIGVKTFGTFMPVLVAIAFRETQLWAGILLFSVIVALGLTIRFYLEKLRLLLVPRLCAVLTVVVLLMAAVSVLSHRIGIETGLSVALFPIVIMTMVIERMSIVWEERGPAEAIREGIGSLIVAALAYVVMSIPHLGHLVFVFPELLLVLLAASLLLGRYTGYRLLELFRFKALAGG